jgi:hypothetical protein
VLLEKLKKEKTSEKHKYEILSFIKYGNIRPEQFKAKDELITLRNKSKEPFFRSYLSFMILLVTVAPEKSTIAT